MVTGVGLGLGLGDQALALTSRTTGLGLVLVHAVLEPIPDGNTVINDCATVSLYVGEACRWSNYSYYCHEYCSSACGAVRTYFDDLLLATVGLRCTERLSLLSLCDILY